MENKESLNKEVFEVHMKNIYQVLDKLDGNIIKLFERHDSVNQILTRNTIFAEEQNKRTLKLELLQIDLTNSFLSIKDQVQHISHDVYRIDNEIQPIKKHVESMNKTVAIITGIPHSLRILALLVMVVSSFFGVYHGIGDLFAAVIK